MNDLYQHNLNLGSDLSYFFLNGLLFYACHKLRVREMAVGDLTACAAAKTRKSSVCHGLQAQSHSFSRRGKPCSAGCLIPFNGSPLCSKVLITAREDAWPQLLLLQVRTGRGVFKSQVLTSCKKPHLQWFSERLFSPSCLTTTVRDLLLKLQTEVSFPLLKPDVAADSQSGVEGKEPSFDPSCPRQHSRAGTGMF